MHRKGRREAASVPLFRERVRWLPFDFICLSDGNENGIDFMLKRPCKWSSNLRVITFAGYYRLGETERTVGCTWACRLAVEVRGS